MSQVLWYVEKPNQPGPVFGYADQWKGMGLFFDSFDNDNKNNNPYISVIVNDGTINYDHARYIKIKKHLSKKIFCKLKNLVICFTLPPELYDV